ncbi:MAG: hypothetical protein DME76_20325 [Verrucomicrobia bacterium]|nr:MAG: hypothetical protein DME76_20325 [Verrucomicrobiota bacterium]
MLQGRGNYEADQLTQRHAVRQLVAKAIAPEGEIIDVFQAAGLKQPDTSTLSDQFLAEVRGFKYKNIAAQLRPKQDPVYNIGHELRSNAIFLIAAVRADHIKASVRSPKASK